MPGIIVLDCLHRLLIKANSWWPARIPKLTERRQMLKERQSQIFEVGIEFSVT